MIENTSSDNFSKKLKEIAFEMNVLLVEDDTILQEQIKLFLARFFASVETACDGEDALQKYRPKKYDLILSDLTMPRMNGILLTQQIKEMDESQKIIIISAHSESEKLIELMNIGVDGFLLKPLNVPHMITQLSKVCLDAYNQKMLHYLSLMLEETNQELRETNIELEGALNEIAYCKTHKEHHINGHSTQVSAKKNNPNEFYIVYDFEIDKANESLENLEYLFNLLLLHVDQNTKLQLVHIVHEYGVVLEVFKDFSSIKNAMQELEAHFKTIDDLSTLHSLWPTITTLFDDLENWRKGLLEYKNVDDIDFMCTDIVQKILKIQGF